ncbi:MAG: DnaJ domain-containing protein [bacterium]|nr:hypothetical protein [Deltaproteobacteria bacterium]MCP4904967.1 DnaJ domain-containing protein [bacterium]
MRGIEELDHYDLLEIGRNATSDEVDRAYRAARQTYTDGSLALYSVFESGDARAICEHLDDAYRILADPKLRAQYDEVLRVASPAPGEADPTASQAKPFPAESQAEFEPGDRGNDSVVDGIEAAFASGSVDEVVEEYDAIEDDGRGEFDGVRLRRNRLFRGYEIDEISEVTKVSGTHLRNIEAENFGDLPADVYVRGFVTAYAQTIGLDPKAVVPSYMARVQQSRAESQRGRFLTRH